jgi:hypothetical protein
MDYLLFFVPLKNFPLKTIAGEGLQNFGLCPALKGL